MTTPVRYALFLTVFARFLASFGNSGWHHPDEWFQTVEFANLLFQGFASHTQEIALHMRNLSWPLLLTIPLKIVHWIAPSSIELRVFAFQFFSGVIDLLGFWGFYVTLKEAAPKTAFGEKLKTIAALLYLLPWFVSVDAIRPSSEHLSSVAIWIMLGLLSQKKFALAGFAAVGVGAMRYAAGIASFGVLVCLAVHVFQKKGKAGPFLKFVLGTVAGLLFFGIPDLIFYGSVPWASFWMYLQYNVFTGLSNRFFGSQGLDVYVTYLAGHWGRWFIAPWGIILFSFFIPGFIVGIKKLKPWAFAFGFYLLAHSIVPHKEPRFIAPIEFLFVMGAYEGLIWASKEKWGKKIQTFITGKTKLVLLKRVLIASALLNSIWFLKGVWGERFRTNETYLELPRHLESQEPVCAVITTRKLTSTLLPFRERLKVPEPPVGFFPTDRNLPSYSHISQSNVTWLEWFPRCHDGDKILVHVHKPDPLWITDSKCKLLESGILRLAPHSMEAKIIEKDWLSGPWYQCPSQLLSKFQNQSIRKTIVKHFGVLPNLPKIGTTGDELLEMREKAFSGLNVSDGILGQ